jgi:hypothetical protein
MAFSESIKNKVKEMSDFKCCRCRHISFEVHHIIPLKNDGPDTLENAAPLCPNCHAEFGDNLTKRKEITQMRDLWYKRVEQQYSPHNSEYYKLLFGINSKLDEISSNQDIALIDLKNILKGAALEAIEQMTADTAVSTASGIASASVSPSPSPSPSFSLPDEDE